MPNLNLNVNRRSACRWVTFVIAGCFVLLSCRSGDGQDRPGRTERGRRTEQGKRSQGDDRSSRIVKFVTRLDRNGNEILEPNEMVGGAANYLQAQGFDTSQPISLAKVVRKFEKRKDKNSEKRSGSSKVIRKVPGFGVDVEARTVPGFVGNESVAMDSVSMEAKYGRRVMELVDRTLEGYDKNQNNALDPQEILAARWGTPPPQTSDTNKDGTISKIELAERYLARDRDANRSRNDSQSREAKRKFVTSQSNRSIKTRLPSKSARPSSSRGRSNSFNSRSRTPSTKSKPRSSTPAYNAGADRYARYAKGLMTQYDQNKDGKLDKTEIGKMRRPPKDSDINGDGFVTSEELTTVLSGGNKNASPVDVTAASLKKTRDENQERLRRTRDSSRTRSPSRNRGSFTELDANGDGQVQMHEFSTDWDGDVLADFQGKDANGDGVITASEWNGR